MHSNITMNASMSDKCSTETGDNTSTAVSSSESDEQPTTKQSTTTQILNKIPFAGRISEMVALPGKDPFSKLANDALDGGDDIFITESFLPDEENSSVLGNASVMMDHPRQNKSSHSHRRQTTSTISNQNPPKRERRVNPRLSISRRIRTISLPGKDKVSQLANHALDNGDDSFLPVEENSSVLGNSSVVGNLSFVEQSQRNNAPNRLLLRRLSFDKSKIPFTTKNESSETDAIEGTGGSTSGEKSASVASEERNDASTHPKMNEESKTLNSLLRKLPLPGKISMAFPGQDPVSKLANDVLDDGDDLYISESFRAKEDNSSLSGNYSEMEPTPRNKASLVSTEEEMIGWVDKAKSVSSAGRDQTKPIISKLPDPGKLGKAAMTLPRKVIRSSQKLLPWRLNPLLTRNFRPGAEKEYKEFMDDNAANPETLLALDIKRQSGANRRQMMRQTSRVSGMADLGIIHSNSYDSDITRGRCLTLDNSSLSGLSDITDDDTIYSKSRSFRLSHSMYIVQPEENLLGLDNDVSEEEVAKYECPDSLFLPNTVHKNDEPAPSMIPDSTETKVFNSLTPHDEYAREAVNGFLNQIEAAQGAVQTWEDFFPSESNQVDNMYRQRIFSDSDVVFENQRQRLENQDHKIVETPHMSLLLNDIVRSYENDTPSIKDIEKRETEFDCDPFMVDYKNSKTLTRSASAEDLMIEQDVDSSFLPRSRVFSDSEFIISCDQNDFELFSTSKTTIGLHEESEHKAKPRRPRFSSDSAALGSPKARNSKEISALGSLHSKASSALKKLSKKTLNSELLSKVQNSAAKVQNSAVDTYSRSLHQLSAISPADAISAARMIAPTYKTDDYYWNLESESEPGSPTEEAEVLWGPDDSLDDIL